MDQLSTRLLLAASLLTLGTVLLVEEACAVRHNILFVVVDDLPTHIQPYLDPSHPLAQDSFRDSYTPILNSLANESIIFHRAYVQNAACNPSRASFLTSRTPLELQLFTKYPFRDMRSAPITLPNAFRRTHWVVGAGKIFHRDWPQQFNKFIATGTGDEACGSRAQQCILAETQLVDSAVTSSVLSLIRSASKKLPWFAFAGYHRPHWMYSTSSSANGVTRPADDEVMRQTVEESLTGALDLPNDVNKVPVFAVADTRLKRSATATKASGGRTAVYASSQWMDVCLGRLLAGLDSALDNTIIIMISDNGVMLHDRSQNGKSVLFNLAKRVPLMIRHPDFKQSWGKKTSSPTDLMDLFPTLLEAEQFPQAFSGLSGKSLMPLIRLLNNNPDANKTYSASVKLGAITIETRCTVANPKILSTTSTQVPFAGEWVACHQIPNSAANRAEMFGLSFQTREWSYVEWRVAQWAGNNVRVPRWDTGGLWGRELYSFAGDDGLVRMTGVEFEKVNLAPCPVTCFPRNLRYPRSIEPFGGDGFYSLPNDVVGVQYDPPDLDQVDPQYHDVVRRLSLAVRALLRDKSPVCNGHGTPNPVSCECDQCIPGWTGKQCEYPVYEEFASDAFPRPPTFAPTPEPTMDPTYTPTMQPSPPPSRSPVYARDSRRAFPLERDLDIDIDENWTTTLSRKPRKGRRHLKRHFFSWECPRQAKTSLMLELISHRTTLTKRESHATDSTERSTFDGSGLGASLICQ